MTIEYKGKIYVYPYKDKDDTTDIEIRRYGIDDYEVINLNCKKDRYRGTLLDIVDWLQQF